MRDCGEFALVADPRPEGIAERGRGFALMHLLMDEVQLQTDGQTEVRLAKATPTIALAKSAPSPA